MLVAQRVCISHAVHREHLQTRQRPCGAHKRLQAQRSSADTLLSCTPDASTVWGAAALVAGTTVGAGILALPAETAAAGLVPSVCAVSGAWGYSVLTGLLLAEVALNAAEESDTSDASFVSLAGRTLGPIGGATASAGQFFLSGVLLVAYTARGGEVLGRLAGVPSGAGAAAFTLALGLLCAAAPPAALDAANSLLLALLLVAFAALLAAAAPGIQPEAFSVADWTALPHALPVVALSFVYHNVVPLIVRTCRGHAPSVRAAIVRGTALPWAMYVCWEVAVLGSADTSNAGADPLAGGGLAVDAFALLAVATSYVGFALSLSDMLLDTPPFRATQQSRRSDAGVPLAPLVLALLPPCLCAVCEPGIFLRALETAGVGGALALCGILPGAMVLAERRRRRDRGKKTGAQLAPGGDATARAVMLVGAAVVAADTLHL